MIEFDYQTCVGCAACVSDCFPGALSMQEKRPVLSAPTSCIGCGHCIAVCPRGAVSDSTLCMEEAVPPSHPPVDPDALFEAMAFRRSCRHYTKEPVSDEALHRIIDAGRRCPTAKNLQGTSFVIVRSELAVLRREALHALGDAGRDMLQNGCPAGMERRAKNFILWEKQLATDPDFDPIFFHAPALILVLCGTEGDYDAAAAAAYMELMAQCMGLGCLYSGYFCAAANAPALKARLGLSESRRLVRTLVVGHPDIRFRRCAPRRPSEIQER